MNRRAARLLSRLLPIGLLGLAAMSAGGCTRQIGDSCKTNLDCNVTITSAFCDLASPQGYQGKVVFGNDLDVF